MLLKTYNKMPAQKNRQTKALSNDNNKQTTQQAEDCQSITNHRLRGSLVQVLGDTQKQREGSNNSPRSSLRWRGGARRNYKNLRGQIHRRYWSPLLAASLPERSGYISRPGSTPAHRKNVVSKCRITCELDLMSLLSQTQTRLGFRTPTPHSPPAPPPPRTQTAAAHCCCGCSMGHDSLATPFSAVGLWRALYPACPGLLSIR